MSSVTPTDDAAARASRILWALGLVLLVGGWLSVLHVYRWNFTAPVFFLWAGWAALLASARFLLRAAMAAAEDTADVEDDFWKPVGRREELVLEKRSLLKAIKEIEFDHQMGKTSAADAEEIGRFYRGRAIEILRELERIDGGLGPEDREELTVREKIERELQLRMQVAPAANESSEPAPAPATASAPDSDSDSDDGAGKAEAS
jgi:hypothetical protein